MKKKHLLDKIETLETMISKLHKAFTPRANSNKPWSVHDCDVIKHSDLSDAELGDLLGRSEHSVTQKRYIMKKQKINRLVEHIQFVKHTKKN